MKKWTMVIEIRVYVHKRFTYVTGDVSIWHDYSYD